MPARTCATTTLLGCLAACALAMPCPARDAEWIWSAPSPGAGGSTNVAWFRHEFVTPPYNWNARLTAVADDEAEIFLNGRQVATCRRWEEPVRVEISMHLHQGRNVLAVRAVRREGRAGLLVHLNLGGAEARQVVSGTNWLATTREVPGWNTLALDASDWSPAVSLGPHGMEPWGDVLSRAAATPAETLRVPPGFKVTLLRSATPGEGSWVAMAFDDRGRLYLSPEGDARPLLRLTLDGSGRITDSSPVPAPVRFAMGLLHAHDSLYANALGPRGPGLYRLIDRNGNDLYDPGEEHLLKSFPGTGEHGYHAIELGPDGRIYVLNGNGTRLPEGIDPFSPYRHYGEDMLTPAPGDSPRHGGALAPGAHVLRTDPDGTHWELFAGGMRNAYDFAFNPDGELFVFDSDNEWDWGTPWYRPLRLFHCISGAEAGWRDGTRAWPDHYPDMIPGVGDVGIGSPTGVAFGTRSNFPERYRRALYLQDWSYGRIFAVHLEPSGASYSGEIEEFLRGQPLNLTSLGFGPDGAMYFITGGRGTQSGLYRVTWEGGPADDPGRAQDEIPAPAREARALRHRLERFHGAPDPMAIEAAWPHLGSDDWAIRHAARVALEAQPPAGWMQRALDETDPDTGLHALLALARVGNRDVQPALLRALGRFPLASLSPAQRLLKYRIVQLSFIRHGRPGPQLAALASEKLGVRYPADSWPENRELSRLLLWLGAEGAVERTIDLIESAPSQEQQIHYVEQLRHVRHGWTPDTRRRYFAWWLQPRDHLPRPGSLLHAFHDAGRVYVDGASLNRHLEEFRRDAIAALDPAERERMADLISRPIAGAVQVPPEPRTFVRAWTMADLLPHLDEVHAGRDFESGRRAFIDTECYACHRLGSVGRDIGPELSGAGARYSPRDLLESLIDPSKVISDQYRNIRVFLTDGEEVSGRLVREDADVLVLETEPLNRIEQAVPRADVEEILPSDISAMPEGLLNVLTRDEILDLLAFLISDGNPEAPAFQAP